MPRVSLVCRMHQLLALTSKVRRFGAIPGQSSAPFESENKALQKITGSGRSSAIDQVTPAPPALSYQLSRLASLLTFICCATQAKLIESVARRKHAEALHQVTPDRAPPRAQSCTRGAPQRIVLARRGAFERWRRWLCLYGPLVDNDEADRLVAAARGRSRNAAPLKQVRVTNRSQERSHAWVLDGVCLARCIASLGAVGALIGDLATASRTTTTSSA